MSMQPATKTPLRIVGAILIFNLAPFGRRRRLTKANGVGSRVRRENSTHSTLRRIDSIYLTLLLTYHYSTVLV